MKIILSNHAKKRINQRGISEIEVQYILKHPIYVKKCFEGKKEAVGQIKNRDVKVVYIEKENYIKVITLL
tara:strand:- start:421 stop:630 length:210 start_codon:yes stop_codon:yes gene_type:complete